MKNLDAPKINRRDFIKKTGKFVLPSLTLLGFSFMNNSCMNKRIERDIYVIQEIIPGLYSPETEERTGEDFIINFYANGNPKEFQKGKKNIIELRKYELKINYDPAFLEPILRENKDSIILNYGESCAYSSINEKIDTEKGLVIINSELKNTLNNDSYYDLLYFILKSKEPGESLIRASANFNDSNKWIDTTYAVNIID